MRKKLQKVFAILLTLSMLLSMMSITAFASGLTAEQEANKAAQVVYAGGTEEVVADKVWMTKTAETTDTEGKFKVTLQVETKDKIKTVEEIQLPTIDVVLVVDCSISMNDNSRMASARTAATAFVDEFLGVKHDNTRRVAVVTYSTGAETEIGLTSNSTNLKDTIRQINTSGSTNIMMGLKEADNILKNSDAQYKYIVLLTDGEPTYYYEGTTSSKTVVGYDNFISVGSLKQDYYHEEFPDFTSRNRKGSGYPNNISAEYVYNTVSYAKHLKETYNTNNEHLEIYGVGIDLSNNNYAKYTMYNTVTQTGTPGNLSYAEHYIACDGNSASDLASKLTKAFNVVVENILVKTNAWIVNDTMGDQVTFAGFVKNGNSINDDTLGNVGAEFKEEGEKIQWDLKALATDCKEKDGKFVYTLQYYVTLDKDYVVGTAYSTNEKATLTYSFEDDVYTENTTDNDGVTHVKGEQIMYKHDFAEPTVQGFEGTFTFKKQDAAGNPLTGATFGLFAADGFNKRNPGTPLYTANATGGNVTFSNIEFGAYKMMETATADDTYDLDVAQETVFDVVVSYGLATATKSNGTPVTAETVFTNYKSQTYTDITVKKVWVDGNNIDSTRPAEITFKLMKQIGNGNKVEAGTYTLTSANNWTITIEDLAEIDLATNSPITYSVIETQVNNYGEPVYSTKDGALTITNIVATIGDTVDVTLNKTWIGPKPADNASGAVEITLSRTSAKAGSVAEVVGTYTVTGTKTIEDLPLYDAEGYRYTYTAAETAVEDYSVVSSKDGTTFNFTNIVDQDTTSVNGIKIWNIAALGETEVQAVFTLTARNYSGFEAQTDIVTSEENEYRFDGLPVYVYTLSDGTKATSIAALAEGVTVVAAEAIEYVVTETSTGANNIVSDKDGTTFTNTLEEDMTIIVEKVWDDNDNAFETRPDFVTLVLSGDGERYAHTFQANPVYEKVEKTVTTTVPGAEGEEATTIEETVTENVLVGYTWDNVVLTREFTVPKYDASGAEITYTVSEEGVEDNTIAGKNGTEYVVSYDQENYKVTNTLNGGALVISGVKTWVDGNDVQGLRPESIEVGLFKAGDAEAIQTVTVPDADGKWTYTFNAVDLYEDGDKVAYIVKEITVLDKYTTTYSGDNNRNITNTLTQEKFSITGAKAWEDADNLNNLRPSSVTLVLTGSDGSVKKGVANAENGWTYEFTGLDKYDANRNVITYTLDEEALTGDDYEKTSTGNKDNNYTVTNTLKLKVVSVSVSKQWVSDEDCSAKEITVQLYQNDVAYGEPKTITGNNSVSFVELPKYDEDTYAPYIYTVKEAAGIPNGYSSSVTSSGVNSFEIKNTKQIQTVSYSVQKTFVGPEAEGSIYAGLFRQNGDSYVKVDTVELNAENEWTAPFAEQPVTDSSYVRYDYVIRELAAADDEDGLVEGAKTGKYTVSYSGSNNCVITNTIDQVTKDLTVVKEWANMEPTDFVTPSEKPVKVQLGYMVAGQFVPYGDPVTLLASGEWTHTYENLPTYALPSEELNLNDGSVVVYEIREVAEDGSLILDGGTISLGEDNRFTVNYAVSENGTLVVTNTFDTPEKYYYRVDRHYYRNIFGTVTTKDVVGDLVTVLPEENREITIGAGDSFVVDTNAYLVNDGYTHTFEKAIPTDVQVLELANHEYVIHLYYNLVRSGGGGGGGGGGGTTIIIPENPVPLDPTPEVVIPEEDVPQVDIPEEDIPMADVPKTGDASALWMMMSVLSGTGLAGVTFLGRKKRDEEN